MLYKDENTGAADVVIDPVNPSTVYASLWQARQGPWENGDFRGPGSGLFKSTDGGTTWRPLTEGLPTWEGDRLGRIGIGISPSQPSRLFLVVEARTTSGIYRSDNAGETWTRVNADERVVARPSDATDIRVHPTNPDIVFVPTIVTWKSTDGGRTFTAIRGAPGGDDYQRAWINPTNPDIIAMTSDQGAVISLNNGEIVEQLVQPADRGVLPRHHRQRISVPGVQRAAGERLGVHLQPRRSRADHLP